MAKGLRGRNCPPSEGQHAMRSLGSHGTQGLLSARGAALTLVGVWGFEWSPNGVWMGWSEAALADTPCWQLHQNLPMGDVFHDGSYSLCGLDFGMCIFLSLLIITLHCKVQATSSSANPAGVPCTGTPRCLLNITLDFGLRNISQQGLLQFREKTKCFPFPGLCVNAFHLEQSGRWGRTFPQFTQQ